MIALARAGERALRTLLPILLLSLALPACWTSAGDGEQMRRDIAALQGELKTEQARNAAERVQLTAQSAQKAKELQDAMDALNRAARKSGADLGVDLEKAQNDLTVLRGQLEVLEHRIEVLEGKQGADEKQLADTAAFVDQRKKQLDAAEHPTDKAGIYALAQKKLDQGDTQRARELFQDFLTRFHGDALASNAQYWLGETFYAEKRYDDAIVAFQKVLKDWKTSEKVPDALTKIGLSFQNLGDCPKAQLFYDEVTADHRGTEAARIAKLKSAECRKAKRAPAKP